MADHYFIDVVNEKDEVIGKKLKSKKSELNFISRVVAVLVKDSNGKQGAIFKNSRLGNPGTWWNI